MKLMKFVFLPVVVGAIGLFAVYRMGITVFAQSEERGSASLAQTPTRAKPAASRHPKPQAQPRQEAQQPRQQQQVQSPQQPAQQAQPQNDTGQQATVFDEHAREGKFTTCAKVFSVLGRGVATDSTYTARTQWDSQASDAHSVQSLVALNSPTNPAQKSAGVVFAAPVGRSCEGTLVRVTPMADNCQAVAASLSKMNGQGDTVGDLPLISLPNGAQIMLVPFNNACVAVTTLRAAG